MIKIDILMSKERNLVLIHTGVKKDPEVKLWVAKNSAHEASIHLRPDWFSMEDDNDLVKLYQGNKPCIIAYVGPKRILIRKRVLTLNEILRKYKGIFDIEYRKCERYRQLIRNHEAQNETV